MFKFLKRKKEIKKLNTIIQLQDLEIMRLKGRVQHLTNAIFLQSIESKTDNGYRVKAALRRE